MRLFQRKKKYSKAFGLQITKTEGKKFKQKGARKVSLHSRLDERIMKDRN